VDIDAARDFVRANHRAVLVTLRRDGSPQTSPVTVGVDADGLVAISSRVTAYKVRNLRRDPRAWVCVMPDAFFGPWVSLAGTASILDLPDAMEPLVDYYRSIAGEHPDWDDYRAAMRRDQRCLVRIQIEQAGPDRSG
jgi:PPOX class probable F420-dependent enzyme